jgi:hypothetical protein
VTINDRAAADIGLMSTFSRGSQQFSALSEQRLTDRSKTLHSSSGGKSRCNGMLRLGRGKEEKGEREGKGKGGKRRRGGGGGRECGLNMVFWGARSQGRQWA